MSPVEAERPRLLAVVGPTGTGKSDVAVRLAEVLGAEIVGCDALQIYRELEAATAKPDAGMRRRVPHHVVDCRDPRDDIDLAEYVRQAEAAIESIGSRERLPIVVGGTGMYLRGLFRGVVPAPARDPELRRRLREIAERGGLRHLRSWLEKIDPDSARRIAPADLRRTVRAIELARSGDGSWADRIRLTGTWSSGRERYPNLKIGLDVDRDTLHRRLDARVDGFFEAGLVREVRALLEGGVPREANAFKAIGYREVLGAILGGNDPDAVRDDVKRSTRRYAKRQRTWFRSEPALVWLDAGRPIEVIVEDALERWRAFTGVSP